MPFAFPLAPQRLLLCLVPAALALTACGGGSDSTAEPEAPAPSVPLTLTGTAATGAAIANRSVEGKCNGGSGSGTSLANGTFTITLAAGRLPCVLRVTAADGSVLHSLATGSGATAKANITPVSELVLANLSGGTPASYFGAFDATAAAALTPAKAQAATSAVVATLKAAGVDLSATGDVLTADLVAASGSTAGNDFDKALDALQAKLASSGTTLAKLAETVASESTAAPVATLSNTPSLPADMLLQPAASNCSALRSGTYRLVVNRPDTDGYETQLLRIDARALTVTDDVGSSSPGLVTQFTADGNCRFKGADGSELVVSQASVIVARISDDGAGGFYLGVAFPAQTHPLSALAGEWNSLQLDRTEDGGPIVLTNGTWTVDAAGKLTAATFCEPGADCISGTLAATADFPGIVGSVHADGGFKWTNAADGWTDRVFLYKTGGGELLRVSQSTAGGHLALWTRKVAGTLPAVGRVSDSWNITQNNNYTASGVSESKNTVRSVDATANSFLRDAVVYQNGVATSVTQPETLRISNPRDGYSLRVGQTVTASDGSSRTVSPFVAMGLRGTGISVVGFPGNNTVVLSVGK